MPNQNWVTFGPFELKGQNACTLQRVSETGPIEPSDAQQTLVDYLLSKTKGERLAARRDLNPADIKHILPVIALYDLDVDADGTIENFTIRLLGTKLTHLYGELTGKTLKDLLNTTTLATSAKRVLYGQSQALKFREAVYCKTEFLDGARKSIEIISLYIPLSDDGVNINKIISCGAIRKHGRPTHSVIPASDFNKP